MAWQLVQGDRLMSRDDKVIMVLWWGEAIAWACVFALGAWAFLV